MEPSDPGPPREDKKADGPPRDSTATVEGLAMFTIRVLSDPGYFLKRVLPTLVLLSLFLLGVILATFKTIGYISPPVSITVEKQGAIEITLPNKKKTSWYLLSPTGEVDSPWTDTGIEIDGDKEVTITASGRATMGIHRVVEYAQKNHDPSPLPWVSPNGLDPNDSLANRNKRAQEAARADYLIYKKKPQGKLLGIISSTRPAVRPDENQMILIGELAKLKPQDNHGGRLWLTVNEVWLDSDTINQLEKADADNKDEYANIRKWAFQNAWYEDNAGAYFVIVEQ